VERLARLKEFFTPFDLAHLLEGRSMTAQYLPIETSWAVYDRPYNTAR